jgi:lauroyl/myristoyl acyltransferase
MAVRAGGIGLAERARTWVRGAGGFALSASLLLLRTVGRVLPDRVLWLLLWPLAMLRSVWELCRAGPTFADYQKLAELTWLPRDRGARLRRLLLGRTQLNLTKLLFLWPEKLASAGWAPCRMEGAERLQQLGRGSRPTILVTLHFGPTGILLNWLRACGHPAAMVALKGARKLPWYRRYLVGLRDRAAGLVGVRNLIELGEIMEMRDHLDSHGLLLIAIDGAAGRNSCYPAVGDFRLAMSTGAFRLAALTGASTIPCLIRSRPFFSFALHLGEPVPEADLLDRTRHAAACDHLLREFLPVLAKNPEECSTELLTSLGRPTPERKENTVPQP